MPVFRFLAKSSPEETVRGEMHAESAAALVTKLTESGLYPLEITPIDAQQGLRRKRLSLFAKQKSRAALVTFTQQLAGMLSAGMTLHAALSMLQRQAANNPLGALINDLVGRLRDGQKFSDACAAWPGTFSKFYVNMIRAGETGGMLELVLTHLADFLEREHDVRRQIQTALAYPLLMLVMGMITVSILLTFVVPKIISMFEEIGQALPLPTRILIAVSHFATSYWPYMLILLAALILFYKWKKSEPGFQARTDRMKLRLPFFGALIIEGEIAQFAGTLRALLAHAVPVHHAFDVVIASCKNQILQEEFSRAAETIRHGGRIGSSLRNSAHLPPLLGDMISVAEDTNQLENVLEKIASVSAKEVERRVAIFTKLLEPAMIVLLGIFIGFIVFAMMMPIFQMDFVAQ